MDSRLKTSGMTEGGLKAGGMTEGGLKASGMTEGGLKASGMTEGMLGLFVMPRHSSVMGKDVVTHMGVGRGVFLGSL